MEKWFLFMDNLLKDISLSYESSLVLNNNVASLNEKMYEAIKEENYKHSFVNPIYAQNEISKEMGSLFSFITSEAYATIGFKFDKKMKLVTHFLKLYEDVKFLYEYNKLTKEALRKRIYEYLLNATYDFYYERIKATIHPQNSLAYRIVNSSNLSNVFYLYEYGEYITKNQLDMARFLNSLSEEEIKKMATTFTSGYKRGFYAMGRPFEKKKTVCLHYELGFERLVKEKIRQFKEMGLETTLIRKTNSSLAFNLFSSGFFGEIPSNQAVYDHKQDAVYFEDEAYKQKRLESLKKVYDEFSMEASVFGGPALIETFGNTPFSYEQIGEKLYPSDEQIKSKNAFLSSASKLSSEYINPNERSFTIIAYPTPQIGKWFKEIFADTVKINTLDNDEYISMQEKIIDVLNTASYVHIKGRNGNETDVFVKLQKPNDLEKEENFENCVADVNIPVGEVFTTPMLKGTNGILHLKRVFLAGHFYTNLKIEITDGMITDYLCENFKSIKKSKEYFNKNVMKEHKTLPLGEFAIGTNTLAYLMSKKYVIENLLPILIAEKCGPHFAFGDTCYSHSEEVRVYNPNGKEIIAKDNEVSIKRNISYEEAYFNCHTDITIPYEEIEYLKAIDYNNKETKIIENGFFVLDGLEKLNEPLSQL